MSVSASIVNGEVVANSTATNTSASTLGTSSLDKDAFLQLLVTQMRYQDPLNPSTDTQYIAQLAQFSSLEEMQNMSTTLSNTQATDLVGKNVIMETTTSSGESTYISGKVDYVEIVDGEANLSINGGLYPVSNLDTVVDDDYLEEITSSSTT